VADIPGLDADIHFGSIDSKPDDWRKDKDLIEEIDPDDDELFDTPKDVIAILGFDPLEEDDDKPETVVESTPLLPADQGAMEGAATLEAARFLGLSLTEASGCGTGTGGFGSGNTCAKGEGTSNTQKSTESFQPKKMLAELSSETQKILEENEYELEDFETFSDAVLDGNDTEIESNVPLIGESAVEEMEEAVWNQAIPPKSESASYGPGGETFTLHRAVNTKESKYSNTFWTDNPKDSRPYVTKHFKEANLRVLDVSIPSGKIADANSLRSAAQTLGISAEFDFELADNNDVRDVLRSEGIVAIFFRDLGPDNSYEHDTMLLLSEPKP